MIAQTTMQALTSDPTVKLTFYFGVATVFVGLLSGLISLIVTKYFEIKKNIKTLAQASSQSSTQVTPEIKAKVEQLADPNARSL